MEAEVAPDLLTAVVEVFERVAARALQQGVLQGYRTVEETLPVVRGRVLHGEQLRRRSGLALPVEVRWDDVTVDTPENRLIRAAVGVGFVCAALGSALVARGGGTVETQDPWALDAAGAVGMKPDPVWYADDGGAPLPGRRAAGRPVAVVDSKYKAEKPSGFPNADVYQMLAHCTRLGLPVGWLVYAKGNEAGATLEVVGAGIEVRARVLDLALPPSDLLAQVDRLVAQIVSGLR